MSKEQTKEHHGQRKAQGREHALRTVEYQKQAKQKDDQPRHQGAREMARRLKHQVC